MGGAWLTRKSGVIQTCYSLESVYNKSVPTAPNKGAPAPMTALVLFVVLFVAGFGAFSFGAFAGGLPVVGAAEEIYESVY